MAHPLIRFVASVCVQDAVYWGNPVNDGYGKYLYDSPRQIKVRWDGKTVIDKTKEGEQLIADAEIMCLEDLQENGLICLGTLEEVQASISSSSSAPSSSSSSGDSSGSPAPTTLTGLYLVKAFQKTPLFRSSTEFVRTAYLKKEVY